MLSTEQNVVSEAPVRVAYPVSSIAGIKINMAFNYHGASIDNNTGLITDAEMIALWLRADKIVRLEFFIETSETSRTKRARTR